MDLRSSHELTGMTFLSRDKVSRGLERVSNVTELASAMENRDVEAAVFESSEVASQETFKPYLEIINRGLYSVLQEFFWNEGMEVSRIGNDEPFIAKIDQALTETNTWYGLEPEHFTEARNIAHAMVREMLKTMRAFKNKRIVRYTTRFAVGNYGTSQESRGYHSDPYSGPYKNEMTVVRTLVGSSTMLKHLPSQRATKPKPGATVAFRLQKDGGPPLNFLHSTPPLGIEEFRFALIFNVADIEEA